MRECTIIAGLFKHRPFVALIATFLVLTTTASLVIPLGEAPDEVSHFSYADALARTGALPPASGPALGEVHQPPLYYALLALVLAPIPRGEVRVLANPDFLLYDPQTPNLLLHPRAEAFPFTGNALAWHLARFVSVFLGGVTVWTTWQLARTLFKDDAVALGAAAFVAFLPEFLFISAVVNNDNLIIALSALAVWQTVRVAGVEERKEGDQREQARAVDVVVLGALLGLAALTKLSGFTLWLFAGAVLAWHVWRAVNRGTALLQAASVFLIACAVFAPYALYNLIHRGDPFGWSLMLQVTPVRTDPVTAADWWADATGLYSSFWARYGGALQLALPDWLYGGFTLLTLVALAGWLQRGVRAWRRAPNTPIRERLREFGGTRQGMAIALFAVFWVVLLGAHVRWVMTVLGADQARQLFPGLPLLAVLLSAGFLSWFRRDRGGAATVWSAAMLLASLFLVGTLATVYRAPVYASAERLPSLGANESADFGGTIRLVDYRVAPARARAGDMVTVETYWEALRDPEANTLLTLQLLEDGEAVVNKDGVPSAGRATTDLWKMGEVYTSRHSLQVPEDAAPGRYRLQLGLRPYGTYEWLKVRGSDTLPLLTLEVVP